RSTPSRGCCIATTGLGRHGFGRPTMTTGDELVEESSEIPGWLTSAVLAGSVALVTLAVAGIPLAMAGWFRPWTVLPALGGMIIAGHRVVAPRLSPTRPVARASHLLAAAVVVGAGLTAAFNGAHHAEHLIVDRDPGVYLTTGAWLTDH